MGRRCLRKGSSSDGEQNRSCSAVLHGQTRIPYAAQRGCHASAIALHFQGVTNLKRIGETGTESNCTAGWVVRVPPISLSDAVNCATPSSHIRRHCAPTVRCEQENHRPRGKACHVSSRTTRAVFDRIRQTAPVAPFPTPTSDMARGLSAVWGSLEVDIQRATRTDPHGQQRRGCSAVLAIWGGESRATCAPSRANRGGGMPSESPP